MRYVLVNSLFGGGAEGQVVRLYRCLGFSKILLLENVVEQRSRESDLLVLNTLDRGRFGFLRLFYVPLYLRKLKKILSRRSTVFSFLVRANFVNVFAKFFIRHRAVLNERTQASLSFRKGLKRINLLLIKWLYPRADLIVANSEGVRDNLLRMCRMPGEKIKVIHNLIDCGAIAEQAREELEERHRPVFSHPVIITAGRLYEPKGYENLVRVFGRIRGSTGDARLVFLGTGSYYGLLRDLAESMGLSVYSELEADHRGRIEESDVYFLGYQQNPFKFFARAALFVLTSLWEGFPNVLLEALASGVPVVSSDCRSGPREILAPGTDYKQKTHVRECAEYGVLMPVFDRYGSKRRNAAIEALWAHGLEDTMHDKVLMERYRKRGPERARDFDQPLIVEQWSELMRGRAVG
jgi:glycosyltransferase involved in cell wall biosynthesis